MSPTMSLATIDLPLPDSDGIQMEYMPFGAARRMLSGSYRVDLRAAKSRWTVQWTNLMAAERASLMNAYVAALATPKTLVLPDGQTCSVMAGLSTWRENQFYDWASVVHYDVTFVLEQV